MLQSFIIVGTQVAILFVLIALGFFGGKIKMLTKDGVKCINDIMLYFVTPCVVINAFQRDFDVSMLKNLLLAMLASFVSHLLCFFLGLIFIRKYPDAQKRVLRFAIIFPNCGFMALPLIEALLGSEGVFYGAGYLAVFNILSWSYGQYSMAKGTDGFEGKKAILNPGVISVIIGLIFFFTSFRLPEIIGSPISYLAALNTPVPMLIIGYTISTLDLKSIFKIKTEFVSILMRLIIAPLLLLALLYFTGYRGTLLLAVMVSASTPVAAITTMFAIKYNQDQPLSSKLVAVSSLFSIVTMTLIISFAKFIGS